MTDPVTIARGLSKAQATTIRSVGNMLYGDRVSVRHDPELADLGLIEPAGSRYPYVTPLGRAVAATLKEMET